MSEITIHNATEMINRIVVPSGGSAHVIIPKKWIGSNVAVVRLED